MKKNFFALLFLLASLTSFAQADGLKVLYEKLGITQLLLQPKSIEGEVKVYSVKADSIYINGYGINLSAIAVTFSKKASVVKLSIGKMFSISKHSPLEYSFVNNGKEKKVILDKEAGLSAEEDTKFLIGLILLNSIDYHSITDYNADLTYAKVRKCGTWDVYGYGNTSAGSLLNATLQAEEFAASNQNCSRSGSASTGCMYGSYICLTSYTYNCKCTGGSIPILGIGW